MFTITYSFFLGDIFSLFDMEQLTPNTVTQLLHKLQGFMNRFQMFVHPVVAVPKHRWVMEFLTRGYKISLIFTIK